MWVFEESKNLDRKGSRWQISLHAVLELCRSAVEIRRWLRKFAGGVIIEAKLMTKIWANSPFNTPS
jgi:hypothetical protein